MEFIDWSIVILPLLGLLFLAFYSKKYTRGVTDYLVAGRVAGRYVISVGDLMSALSVISLVAGVEQAYQTGFSVGFWGAVFIPINLFIALSGFCIYRWRETRCLSLGQFLELRYGSKFFRIFCASLRTIAEMITNAIGPAIAANFFIYYLGLPHKIMIAGISLPCYGIIVFLCLTLAVLFILPGGRVSLLITDAVQGLLTYPIFVVVIGYILLHFSWGGDIVPVMWNRGPGESFMNPYDISQLRDFNIFAIIVSFCGSILNRASWFGNDTSGAGRSPHEQKMAGILGTWRNGFSMMAIMILAMISLTFMNNPKYRNPEILGHSNIQVREALSAKILDEVVESPDMRTKAKEYIARVPEKFTIADWERPNSQKDSPDTAYLGSVREALGDTPEARHEFQKFRSLYYQMMMPSMLGTIFPIGLLGLFCLLMIMLLISTDDSRIFNASSTLMQDVFLPLYKRRLDPKVHLRLLRLITIGVALFFFAVSLLFAQLDYINMFTTILCSLWMGGAGPIMVFGLYSRFGNLTGAWCAIFLGSGTSLIGLICQRNWADIIYPYLDRMGWNAGINTWLQTISSPFNPWIEWSMDPIKFPINSFEIYFISMILSIGGYIIGSYLTYKPYNLEKLLHRGIYADGPEPEKIAWTFRNIFSKIIDITPEYTKGDKIIAYSVFGYSFIYGLVLCFLGVILWNAIYPWPNEWWNIKFFITSLLVPSVIGIVSTVWFMIGGTIDVFRLFRDLAKRQEDDSDNGQVLHSEKRK